MQVDQVDSAQRRWFRQFIYFAAAGAIGTFAHYLLLLALVERFASPPVPASTAGFLLGASVNYILNYRYTFRSNRPHSATVWKFFVVALAGATINTGLMAVLVDYFHWHYLVSQVIATGLVLTCNFVSNRLWTFSEET